MHRQLYLSHNHPKYQSGSGLNPAMNTLKDRGNLPFNQATPQESTGPIDSLTDCLRRCTATGDFQTQESLVKIILSATATAQRLISLKEERIPTDTKLKDLEQANSDSIDQIKLLNAKNRALKDSKLELQLSANWYKERLVESQLAEKERFHAEKILNSRLSKALMREEKLNKNLQEIRLSFGTFVKKLAEICNLSEIEGLLDDNLREWIDLGDFGAGTYEESFLARESAQAINDLSREIGRGVERFQTSRAGMRVSKQSEISVHTTRTNHQYTKTGDVEPSLSSIQDSEGGSYYQNVQWADSDNSDGRHRPDEERGYVNEFRINEAFNNHPKVQTRGQAFNNGLQAKNVFRDPITNLGTRVRSLTAEEINPTVWKASPDEIPGSWNDVPTPPELLKKKNVVVKKENCGRVIKLTRLPMEITTAMLSTFVRGGKVEEIRIIAADKSNSYKQALITFCKPESATKFFNWVQEHPGSLVVDGLRCHAVVGVTTEPRVYDLEVRVLLLSRLPEVVNSINKLREFVQQTSHDDDGHPFTIQSQKLYFNGGGSKISASVVFNSIEGAIHMKKKWEVSWGMNIEWGRDECEEGRLLDMDPQMKFFWFTQPKPSGLQYD